MYAVGGYDGATRQCLASVEAYNAETNTWHQVADMSERRSGAGVGVLNGLIWCCGGHDGPLVSSFFYQSIALPFISTLINELAPSSTGSKVS